MKAAFGKEDEMDGLLDENGLTITRLRRIA
jgi:hypothetical protein